MPRTDCQRRDEASIFGCLTDPSSNPAEHHSLHLNGEGRERIFELAELLVYFVRRGGCGG